jgi:hypothetical protein
VNGQFEKDDPRINRAGRPKVSAELRKLAQAIANEPAMNGNDQPITRNGVPVSVAENILRKMALSQNEAIRLRFIDMAFGKSTEVEPTAEPKTVSSGFLAKVWRAVYTYRQA